MKCMLILQTGGMLVFEGPDVKPLTPSEIEQRGKERIALHMQTMAKLACDATPLECDYCNKQFGWAYECDLNGSYFFCKECREKLCRNGNSKV